MEVEIELIEPGREDIAAARRPAMMSPGSPDGTCSTMNFGKTAFRRISGSDEFIAYGVLNGQVNDDASFVTMVLL